MDEKSYAMLRILFKDEKGLRFEEWLKKTQNKITIGKDTFIDRKKELENEKLVILKDKKYLITIREEYLPIYRDFYKKMYKAEKFVDKIHKKITKDSFEDANDLILILWYNYNRFLFKSVCTDGIQRGEDFMFVIVLEWHEEIIRKILSQLWQQDRDQTISLIKNIEKKMFPIQ